MSPKGFSIHDWYDDFKIFTTETVLIQLDEEIIEYLLQDRIILPNDDDDKDNDSGDNDEFDNEETVTKQFLKSDLFQQFYQKVHKTIQYLNNAVFVKSNWRSPQDAKWISPGRSLKVETVNDLLLLLKSSEIIRNDFRRNLHSNIEKPILVIQKWVNIHPGAEFRCIILKKTLVGISPRDWPTYYEHFDRDGSEIVAEIDNFFIDYIKDVFLHEDSYIMDIVRSESEPIKLIDFGPLKPETELYAFGYTEIMNIPDKDLSAMKPVFRYLAQNTGIYLKSNYNPVSEDLKDYLLSNLNK